MAPNCADRVSHRDLALACNLVGVEGGGGRVFPDWESQRDSVTQPGVVPRMRGYPGNRTPIRIYPKGVVYRAKAWIIEAEGDQSQPKQPGISAINRVDEFLKTYVGEVLGISRVETSDAVLFERYSKHAVENVSGLGIFI